MASNNDSIFKRFYLHLPGKIFITNHLGFPVFDRMHFYDSRPLKLQRFDEDDKLWTPKSIIQQGIGKHVPSEV